MDHPPQTRTDDPACALPSDKTPVSQPSAAGSSAHEAVTPPSRPSVDGSEVTTERPPAEGSSSSLDRPETNRTNHETAASDSLSRLEPDAAASFRHSFWRKRRMATLRALVRHGGETARVARFLDCGGSAWVLQDAADPNRLRLAANHCHDRFCEACQADRRRLVGRNLQTAFQERFSLAAHQHHRPRFRFLTLTLKGTDKPLATQVKRLYESFRKLRARPFWKEIVTGGLYFLELQVSERTGFWHPHLHVLLESDFLPQDQVRKAWHQITDDSFIVDVRLIRTPAEAVGYVVKYASKAISSRVWSQHEKLVEAVAALVGTRTYSTFGSWRGLHLLKPPDDATEWIPIGTLIHIFDRADRGDAAAAAIVSLLRKGRFTHHATNEAPDEDSS